MKKPNKNWNFTIRVDINGFIGYTVLYFLIILIGYILALTISMSLRFPNQDIVINLGYDRLIEVAAAAILCSVIFQKTVD